jgi:hypothetical protein
MQGKLCVTKEIKWLFLIFFTIIIIAKIQFKKCSNNSTSQTRQQKEYIRKNKNYTI